MGIFDGVLIASDWDGTLFNGEKVPCKNIEAIKYFIENGGHFTVSSGRQHSYIEESLEGFPINTYAIALNGAYISDVKTGEILFEGFIDESAYAVFDKALLLSEDAAFMSYIAKGDYTFTTIPISEYRKRRNELAKRGDVYDLVLRTATPEGAVKTAAATRELLEKEENCDYTAVRSFPCGVEILKKDLTKGVGARRVARAVGANFLVGVGDYENDIHLLKECDIGYAVENAMPSLKAVADRITVGVNEGAIAKIIEDIERDKALKK